MFPYAHIEMHIIFLTLVLDIVGFSLIFPLFPALLEHYLGGQQTGLLGSIVSQLDAVCHLIGHNNTSMKAVLFGGLLAAFYSILQFTFMPLWGSLSDRFGRRPVMLGSILGGMLGYAIWFFAGSFWMLLLSRFITGSTSANMAVGAAAMADLSSEKKRSMAMALVGISFGLGFIIGPMIGGFSSKFNLLAHFPAGALWGLNPFSGSALLALLLATFNFLCAWKFLKETLPASKRKETPIPTPWERSISFMRTSNWKVRKACWVNFWFIFVFSGMEFSLNFLAHERLNFTPAQNGMLFGFIGIIMILTQGLVVRRLGPIIGEKPLCLIGFLIGIGGFWGLSQATAVWTFFLSAGCMALCSALMNGLMSLNSLYSDEQTQGQDMGNFRSAAALGRSVGPLVAGNLYFVLGAQFTYQFAALALLVPFLLAFFLPKTSHKAFND